MNPSRARENAEVNGRKACVLRLQSRRKPRSQRTLRGERQILAVSRAIESNPKLLLLDEPFTLLSLEDVDRFVNLIKEINKKTSTTIIVVSHTLSLIKEVSHYIMLLKNGQKVFFEPADSVSIDRIIETMIH